MIGQFKFEFKFQLIGKLHKDRTASKLLASEITPIGHFTSKLDTVFFRYLKIRHNL